MDFFFDFISRFNSRIALIEGKETLTYSQLVEKSDVFGNYVQNRCLVFILCGNNFESVSAYIGCLRNKIVPLLLGEDISLDALNELIKTYCPQFVFAPIDMVIDGKSVYFYKNYRLIQTCFYDIPKLHEQLSLLLTTSGSTGSKKVVRQSYKNIQSNTEAIVKYLNITSFDKSITTLPMNYTYGLSVIQSHIMAGATIFLNTFSLMDKRFWQSVKDEQITSIAGVPYMYKMMDKIGFTSMKFVALKTMTQAGGKLDSIMVEKFALYAKRHNINFFVMYGQTEATARMSYLPPHKTLEKSSSIGIAIPGGNFSLSEDNELIYKGQNVALGYATSVYDLAEGDVNNGILYTGDIARVDEDGFYYIVGRKNRFLKIFGNRVNLDEVELFLNKNGFNVVCSGEDDNLRVYTIDKYKEKQILNTLCLKTGLHLSAFKVIEIKAIPRNNIGKILYSELDNNV